MKSVPRGKAIWNANGGFVSVLLTHLFYIYIDMNRPICLSGHLSRNGIVSKRGIISYFLQHRQRCAQVQLPPTLFRLDFQIRANPVRNLKWVGWGDD